MFYDFTSKYMDIFWWKKMREAFAVQKRFVFFNKKYWHTSDINVWNFNETLTNDVVSVKQPDPEILELTM